MDKIKIKTFLLALGLIFVLACSQQVETPQSSVPSPVSEGLEEVAVAGEQEAEEATEPEPALSATQVNGQEVEQEEVVKEFTMTAKQREFVPGTITVNKGDKVKITVTSIDVTHGFRLPDFGVNERLDPGKPVDIEFVADKVGTFTFSCSVPCGSGHGGMRGQLVVS